MCSLHSSWQWTREGCSQHLPRTVECLAFVFRDHSQFPLLFFGTPFLSPLTYLDRKSGEEEQAVCKGSKLTTDMAPLMVEPY